MCGWDWLVVDGFWVVVADFGWFWLVFGGSGWFWLVACFITNAQISLSYFCTIKKLLQSKILQNKPQSKENFVISCSFIHPLSAKLTLVP